MEPGLAALLAVAAGYLASALVAASALLGAGWRLHAALGVAGVAASTAASLAALLLGEGGSYRLVLSGETGIGLGLRVDGLSATMAVLVSILSLLIALYSVEYIGEWGSARYWVFYSFFVASMLLLVYADDLSALIAGWEGTGLASWALIGFYLDDREEAWVGDPGRRRLGVPMWFTPTHSALRAVSFTRLGDSFMLIAFGVWASVLGLGSARFSALGGEAHVLAAGLGSAGLAAAWLVMLYMGALAKSAQFPFHEWLVTAMTGPTSVSALIHAATMVKAGVYLALRVTPLVAPVFLVLGGASVYRGLAWLALFTAFSTATMALAARELKLVLAFSTASQLSYMMAAVFAAAAAGEPLAGSYAGYAHLVSHAVFKAALFLAAGAVIHAVHSRYMDDMGGLRRLMPFTFLAFLLAGLSLAAVPPWSGWWSKDATVEAIALLGHGAELVAVATAFLTALYTGRMIHHVFLGEYRGRRRPHEPGALMLVPYLVLGVASLGLGLAWPWVSRVIAWAVGLREAHAAVAVLGTAAALAGLAASGVYVALPEIGALVAGKPVLRQLHGFLYDRWLVNPLIYRLVVYPGLGLARLLSRLERHLDAALHETLPGIGAGLAGAARALEEGYDTLFHAELPRAAAEASRAVRSLQRGDVRDYMAYFTAGMVAAAIVSALVIILAAGG